MNDPNGLIEYKEQFHIFYQHNPYDTKWGPMHWGHAVSRDFVNWEELSIALRPDEEYEDDGGCFSGSAIEKDGRLYLFYTSVSKKYGQAQSVAFSDDGIHFEKYAGNPVIRGFPNGFATGEFRDPKVFRYDGEYRMIVGTVFEGRGRIVMYKSADLLDWKFDGVLYEAEDYENCIECPDLFPLGDKWVLMYSRIGCENSHVVFMTGGFNGNSFTPEGTKNIEFGPQFYAPQTFETADGRRILIGWFYDWNREVQAGSICAGALTIPREVTLDADGRTLRIYPVREVANLLEECLLPREFEETVRAGLGRTESVEALCDGDGVELFVNKGELNFSFYR